MPMSPARPRDTDDIRARATLWALVTATAVIAVLTAAAFWLSYAHLAGVAGEHGLGNSPVRQWAWPATLDLFIIAGEVLMFVAALRSRTSWWAIGLTVAGSMGSIGLNVAGVGLRQPVLDYVVAAVPPSAALLAFGALMRQVHHFIVDVPVPVSRPVVPEPVVPVSRPVVPVSRPKSPVPAAVSPSRSAVHVSLEKPGTAGTATVVVPPEKMDSLSLVVQFLTETGHGRAEIRKIVPTLTGYENTNPETLKKSIQRHGPKA